MARNQRELKALRQAQKEEALRRQRAKERRSVLLIGAGVVLAGALIFGVAAYLNHASQVGPTQRLTFQAQTGVAGTAVPDEGSRAHIDPSQSITYKHYPPTSGPHYASPAEWQTIASLPEGTFIHNLEHGGIVILYNCPSGNACDTLRKQLENYVQNRGPVEPEFNEVKLIMSPYLRGMTTKIALLAWDWIDQFDTYDEARITRFYEVHVDKGPEPIA